MTRISIYTIYIFLKIKMLLRGIQIDVLSQILFISMHLCLMFIVIKKKCLILIVILNFQSKPWLPSQSQFKFQPTVYCNTDGNQSNCIICGRDDTCYGQQREGPYVTARSSQLDPMLLTPLILSFLSIIFFFLSFFF